MWLALETATDQASVAVGETSDDAVEERLSGARRHAGALLPMIERVLRRRGASLDHITGLLLSDGPGSFTGLRVGASAAKALARTRQLPLRVAPSLLVRAAGVAKAGGVILAVADALRGDVYAGAFRVTEREVEVVMPPAARRPEALTRAEFRPDVLVGELPDALAAGIEQWAGLRLIRPPEGTPSARTLLRLLALDGGTQPITDAQSWEPVYGRPAEAQARWEAAHGRPLSDSAGGAR